MNDLISKTEALIKIRGCYPSLPIFKKNRKVWQEKYEGYIKAYEIIQDLPTVEPKTGHWIGTEYDGYADGHPVYDVYECSECGMEYDATDGGEITHNFCPNCGAKMQKGVRNERNSQEKRRLL